MTTTERTNFVRIGSEVSLIAQGTMTDQPGLTDIAVGLHDDTQVWIEIPLDLGIAGDTVSISLPLDRLRQALPPELPFIAGEYVMHRDLTTTVGDHVEHLVLRVLDIDDQTAIVATGDGARRIPVGQLVRPRTLVDPS